VIPTLARNRSGHDTPRMFFTPRWQKEAKLLAKGARKFIHYKRDLLKPDRVAEIESRRTDLLQAARAGDRAKADEASKQLRATCENSLRVKPPTWLEENVEVLFVAIVIALGLRTYFIQPFRIPTGSMQPTLNGIIGKPVATKDWPSVPTRVAELALRGRRYVKVVNDRDRSVRFKMSESGPMPDLRDSPYAWLGGFRIPVPLFSRSDLVFNDGSVIHMPAPASQIYELGLADVLRRAMRTNGVIPAGTVLCEGTLDAGDLVLVDRLSYHFRRPQRGEVFVFDTRGIEGVRGAGGDQANSTHYIKRLCGVPGDTLAIAPPHLLVNGHIATEPGIANVYRLPLFQRSSSQEPTTGYAFANPAGSKKGALLTKPSDQLSLRDQAPYGFREYAALGDNSGNSLDSRYWGSVKEFNLVGPAAFSLWPITTGHWGLIR
jgi:signal peptidase I